MQTSKRLIGIMVLGLLMAGCYEEATIEFREPGVYKGKPDPLLQRSGTPEYQSQLQDRLIQIQTDR